MTDPEELACQELVEQVTDYLEDALDPAARARFEHHLRSVTGASSTSSRSGARSRSLRAVPQDEVLSAQARSRLVAAFREWQQDRTTEG
jgi:hypothetical protein